MLPQFKGNPATAAQQAQGGAEEGHHAQQAHHAVEAAAKGNPDPRAGFGTFGRRSLRDVLSQLRGYNETTPRLPSRARYSRFSGG